MKTNITRVMVSTAKVNKLNLLHDCLKWVYNKKKRSLWSKVSLTLITICVVIWGIVHIGGWDRFRSLFNIVLIMAVISEVVTLRYVWLVAGAKDSDKYHATHHLEDLVEFFGSTVLLLSKKHAIDIVKYQMFCQVAEIRFARLMGESAYNHNTAILERMWFSSRVFFGDHSIPNFAAFFDSVPTEIAAMVSD